MTVLLSHETAENVSDPVAHGYLDDGSVHNWVELGPIKTDFPIAIWPMLGESIVFTARR
jgi:hypothetical protein